MTANQIADVILQDQHKRGKICITNYSGNGLSEADVLVVSKTHYLSEFEIKTSLSDFKADFKKAIKHKRLQGEEHKKYNREWVLKYVGTTGVPNYFSYVCIKDLIDVSLIPKYAGLYYVDGETLVCIKKPPRIHNLKVTDKFYMSLLKTHSARMIFSSSYLKYKHSS